MGLTDTLISTPPPQFFLCGVLKTKVYQSNSYILEELKALITKHINVPG